MLRCAKCLSPGQSRTPLEDRESPQRRFIHMHQLFRIQYTWFELDTVNIDCWIRINFCLVEREQADGNIDNVGRNTFFFNVFTYIYRTQPTNTCKCNALPPSRVWQMVPSTVQDKSRVKHGMWGCVAQSYRFNIYRPYLIIPYIHIQVYDIQHSDHVVYASVAHTLRYILNQTSGSSLIASSAYPKWPT